MPITHAISEDQTCLLITITGQFTLSIAEAMINQLLPVATTAGISKVLVDARGQMPPLDILSAHELGLVLAQPELRGFAIAIVVPDALEQPHHIEVVAQNRGRNVRYFNDPAQARAWLGVAADIKFA